MKAYELLYLLKPLPPDSQIDILHIVQDGKTRAYSVVNVHEDALGSHIIIESKRKLARDAEAEDGL